MSLMIQGSDRKKGQFTLLGLQDLAMHAHTSVEADDRHQAVNMPVHSWRG